MNTRTLIYEDAQVRRYEVRDPSGKVVGYDDEPVLTPEMQQEAADRKTVADFLAKTSPTGADIIAAMKASIRLQR